MNRPNTYRIFAQRGIAVLAPGRIATLAHKGIAILLFLAFLLPALLLTPQALRAQYSIQGNTCVMPGSWIGPYTIVGGAWGSTDEWCVTGGIL